MSKQEYKDIIEIAFQQFHSRGISDIPSLPFFTSETAHEETPATIQMKLALDFYNIVSSLMNQNSRRGSNPSTLDIMELHQLHIEAIRKNTPSETEIPDYSLSQALNAGKRLWSIDLQAFPESEENTLGVGAKYFGAHLLLDSAIDIEVLGYPLVLKKEAEQIQQTIREEAVTFLNTKGSHIIASTLSIYHDLPPELTTQILPDEHPDAKVRKTIHKSLSTIQEEVNHMHPSFISHFPVLDRDEIMVKVTESIASGGYTLNHLYAASKRAILPIDVKKSWNDSTRDVFAVNKVLKQAIPQIHG